MEQKKKQKSLAKSLAMKGNNNREKLTTPELRKKVFDHFCEHLKTGLSKECWFYEDETGLTMTLDGFDRYMREYRHEFDMDKYDAAFRKGMQYYENVGSEIAIGKNEKGNVAALQMIMRNKFGWDKKKELPAIDPQLLENFSNLMGMLSSKQGKNKD